MPLALTRVHKAWKRLYILELRAAEGVTFEIHHPRPPVDLDDDDLDVELLNMHVMQPAKPHSHSCVVCSAPRPCRSYRCVPAICGECSLKGKGH